jgi:hypothetical protein
MAKISCAGNGNKTCFDLKKYGHNEMDTLKQFAENMIYKSLLRGKKSNDTVVNGFRFVWKKAVLLQKDNIKSMEYILKVKKAN